MPLLKLNRGDKVGYRDPDGLYQQGLVANLDTAWHVALGHVEIARKNKCVLTISRVNVVEVLVPREKVKDWWLWL